MSQCRGQKYLNIGLVLQDEWLTTFTRPANTCTCPLKAYACNKELKLVICNTTSSSNSFESTRTTGRVLWEELLVLSRFHLKFRADEWKFCPLQCIRCSSCQGPYRTGTNSLQTATYNYWCSDDRDLQYCPPCLASSPASIHSVKSHRCTCRDFLPEKADRGLICDQHQARMMFQIARGQCGSSQPWIKSAWVYFLRTS